MHFRSINLFFCVPLLLLIALSFSAQANSLLHNPGSWLGVTLTNPFAQDSRWRYEVWIRERSIPNTNTYQLFANAGVFYQVSRNFSFGGGSRYLDNNGNARNESRIYQSVLGRFLLNTYPIIINTGTMLEQRFLEGRSNEVGFRFRQRVGLSYTVNSKLDLLAWDEIFLPVNRPSWASQHPFDQNRLFLGFRVPISNRMTVSIGYLNQYLRRDPNDIMNHIFVMILNL